MTLLITGGCGFIGSELVRQAVEQGRDVVNIDALTYAANPANLASVENKENYRFKQVDIRDHSALSQLFKDIEPCLLYTSPSPRDRQKSRMPSSA